VVTSEDWRPAELKGLLAGTGEEVDVEETARRIVGGA
jgi:hypothetical protein